MSVTRRDFLNGMAIAVVGGLSPAEIVALAPGRYPPAERGFKGSQPGSFDVAHALRDGKRWSLDAVPASETVDLVVVGAGLSGLAAATFWRKRRPSARILVLDAHADFGGHAHRNEFDVDGRTLVSYGGSESLQSPTTLWDDVAKGLIRELGVDLARFETAFHRNLYASLKLAPGVFFDAKTFGRDVLVTGFGVRPWPDFLREAPLTEPVRRDILRAYTERVDYLAGLSLDEKRARLGTLTYADFLTRVVGLRPEVLPFFQKMSHDWYGVGIDSVSALDCLGGFMIAALSPEVFAYPGFQGLGLDGESGGEWKTAVRDDAYIYHFPDGNASIARLLVRALIPEAVPGRSMDDVVTARVAYERLDLAGSPVRLRLSSTVVRASPASGGGEATVAYARGGKVETVRARQCVLACWNGVIPYVCPDLPSAQKEALAFGAKVPLVYTKVLIRDWKAFVKLGVSEVYCPGSYYSVVALDLPVSLGDYRFPTRPEEPMPLHLLRTPCRPGLPARQQHRVGRAELQGTPFETFERQARDQLQRLLGPGGFVASRDVLAVTVNRWSHGYAYEYSTLDGPGWPRGESPCEIGRRRHGPIAIANSDAAASAHTEAAIDEAHRAVAELREGSAG